MNPIISESIARYTEKAAYLRRRLSDSILVEHQFLVVATFEGLSFDLVLGSWERPGKYGATAPRCFASILAADDSLCGCSFFSAEGGASVVDQLLADGSMDGRRILSVRLVHHRDVWTERLAFAEDIVSKFEALKAAG